MPSDMDRLKRKVKIGERVCLELFITDVGIPSQPTAHLSLSFMIIFSISSLSVGNRTIDSRRTGLGEGIVLGDLLIFEARSLPTFAKKRLTALADVVGSECTLRSSSEGDSLRCRLAIFLIIFQVAFELFLAF